MSGNLNSVLYSIFVALINQIMKPSSYKPRPAAIKSKSFEVKENTTLLDFLFQALSNQSKTTVKSLLAHKQIGINGRATKQFDAPLKPGDIVNLGFDKAAATFSHPMLNIIFEDESLIIIDKMSGLLSMATERDKEKTAYHILSEYVKRSHPRNRIFILHRLDRETSGIMMFAKNMNVQEALQKNWYQAISERKYVAVIEGCPEKEEGVIKSYIAENSAFVVHTSNAQNGKLAITNYRILKTNRHYSLIELDLETGRKNQIRVHMQELGTPIAGDKKYGAQTNPINRLALHAFKLRFVHPVTRKEMNFETPIPKRFSLLVKAN